MKKIALIMVSLFFVFSLCYSQKKMVIKYNIPDGRWISVQDSLEVLVVKGKQAFKYYDNLITDTAKYYFTRQSCNKEYKSSNKDPIFLVWSEEMLCFEVVGITTKYIELIYTITGKTITYKKNR